MNMPKISLVEWQKVLLQKKVALRRFVRFAGLMVLYAQNVVQQSTALYLQETAMNARSATTRPALLLEQSFTQPTCHW